MNLTLLRRDHGLVKFFMVDFLDFFAEYSWITHYKNPWSFILPGKTFRKEILDFTSCKFRNIESKRPVDLLKSSFAYHGLGAWFDNLLYQTRSIVAGSFMLNVVVRSLCNVNRISMHTRMLPYGDIDIFMTDLTQIEQFQKAFDYNNIKYEAIRTKNSISVRLTRGNIGVIQFILCNVKAEELLHTFDIPISAIMYYRGEISMTKESIFELMYGIHVNQHQNTKQYIPRLVKYSVGFGKKHGKRIKLLFPYYNPINITLTGYSINDFWRIVRYDNYRSCSHYGNGLDIYNNHTLNNLMVMGEHSAISTTSFCLDGKTNIDLRHIDFKKPDGDTVLKYLEKIVLKLKKLEQSNIGEVDWKKTIRAIKQKSRISADLYNGNDLREQLIILPIVLIDIIGEYIGDTEIDITKISEYPTKTSPGYRLFN